MDKHDVNIFRLGIDSILNSNYGFFKNIDDFFELVKVSGYPYFAWDRVIYKVSNYQEGYTKVKMSFDDIRERDLKNP